MEAVDTKYNTKFNYVKGENNTAADFLSRVLLLRNKTLTYSIKALEPEQQHIIPNEKMNKTKIEGCIILANDNRKILVHRDCFFTLIKEIHKYFGLLRHKKLKYAKTLFLMLRALIKNIRMHFKLPKMNT